MWVPVVGYNHFPGVLSVEPAGKDSETNRGWVGGH